MDISQITGPPVKRRKVSDAGQNGGYVSIYSKPQGFSIAPRQRDAAGQASSMQIEKEPPQEKVWVRVLLADGQVFVIPKDDVCIASEYFRCALHPQWPSGISNTIDLSDQNAHAVNMFLRWAAKDIRDLGLQVEKRRRVALMDPLSSKIARRTEWAEFADCYKVADYLMAYGWKNELMEYMVQNSKATWEVDGEIAGSRSDELQFVFGKDVLPSLCRLRRLVVHNFHVAREEGIDTTNYVNQQSGFEFFPEFISNLRGWDGRWQGRKPWENKSCIYHEHPAGAYPCSKDRHQGRVGPANIPEEKRHFPVPTSPTRVWTVTDCPGAPRKPGFW